jgi:hypothetical protein
MKENNFYSDIKESLEQHFSFLKDFGFPQFDEKQLAYEFHFETKNNFVSLDISFEAITSTPIWATINGCNIGNLELKNQKIEDYKTELKENYEDLFEQYLKTSKNKFLDKISKQYAVNGKEINDKYLKELSEILKRHITVLNGDFELLKSNTEIVRKEYELKEAMERIRNGTYTLEYQLFSDDDYDAFEEFNSINDLKQYLVDRSEIKKYRVLDCYKNEIVLTE